MKEDCKQALARAYLYLDGEVLGPAERKEIEVHLLECAPCYERVGLEREFSALLSKLRGSDPCPTELRSRIRSLIRGS